MSMRYHILNNELLFSSQSSVGRRVVSYTELIIMTFCPNDTTLMPLSHLNLFQIVTLIYEEMQKSPRSLTAFTRHSS